LTKSLAMTEPAAPGFGDLAAAAAAVEGQGSAELGDIAPPAAPIEQGPNYAAEARDAVDFFGEFLGSLFPSVRKLWDQDTRARLAEVTAPVLQKYGITMEWLGPELLLAAVAVPLATKTYQAVRDDVAAAKRPQQQEKAARQPAAAPGGVVHVPVETAAQQPVVTQTDPTSLHVKA